MFFKFDWKKEEIFDGELPLIFSDFLRRGID
jgi:hypothetical protein